MPQKSLWIALMIAMVVGLLSVLAWFMRDGFGSEKPALPPTPVVTSKQSLSTASVPMAQPVSLGTGQLPPLPKSLQGTQVDGELIIDERKQLVVTNGLRRLFDYFLSAQGEESLETINRRVHDYIKTHAPEPAAGQALKVYQQYLTYLQQVAAIDGKLAKAQPDLTKPVTLDINVLTQREQAVAALRERLFDAKTIEAFFGADMALNRYTLQAIQLQKNPNLSASERASALAQARTQYVQSFSDPNVRERITQQDNVNALLAETERLKSKGASAEQIAAVRRQYVSEDAVQRLAALDQSEAQFEQRVSQFNQSRAQILAQQGNTPQAQQAIQTLQHQQFSPTEQLRLTVVTKLLASKDSQ